MHLGFSLGTAVYIDLSENLETIMYNRSWIVKTISPSFQH